MRTTGRCGLRSWLPLLVSLLTSAVALVDLVAVLRPSWIPPTVVGHVDPLHPLATLTAAVIPVCAALLVVSAYLRRGHARALQAVIVLLAVLGATKLAYGPDLDGAVLMLGLGVALLASRREFPVRTAAVQGRRLALPVAAVTCGVGLLGALWVLTPNRPPAPAYVSSALTGSASDAASAAVILAGSLFVLTLLPVVLGPGRPRIGRSDEAVREILHLHGSDTLAAFKLRTDLDHFVTDDAQAFAAFRVEAGTVLLAGDPVGDSSALPGLLRELQGFAEAHGLRVGVVGASKTALAVYRALGMRALYIGDEAIVDVPDFSLEGRAIRKVRQAVARIERAGFTASTVGAHDVDARLRAELERVSCEWRCGHPERGFAMAIDSLVGGAADASLLVVARDPGGVPRGFLQFLPTYGRAAMSLSAMRRDSDVPNGLMEFLVVSAIDAMRERGIDELSLNFAAFGSVFRSPWTPLGRTLVSLLRLGNRLFQIESLYRFNAKFRPRWEPRYLVFDGALAFPRVGLAALWAEGQLPRVHRA